MYHPVRTGFCPYHELSSSLVRLMQERYLVEQLGAPGFYHIIARYGYSQRVQQVWHSPVARCFNSLLRQSTGL